MDKAPKRPTFQTNKQSGARHPFAHTRGIRCRSAEQAPSPSRQALASEAEAAFKDGRPFSVTVPVAGKSGSGSDTAETLTGVFQ
jgi:hypothetical protein